ncbi:MAG: hypothetical protein EG828_13675 [Deltaproteobacteria bacterium]|nr:hypothetical protein [Deltaproteobacteria bacterium]
MIDDTFIQPLSRLFKLMNDPNRLRIIFAIGKEKMRLSEESTLYFLSKMLREGKITVGEVRVKKGTI